MLAHVAACVADGWIVARTHRELPFVKRSTLKRKVTNIRRSDSGQRKQQGPAREGAQCVRGSVNLGSRQGGRSLARMRDWLASHIDLKYEALTMSRNQWMPFLHLLSSPQSLRLENGAPSHTAKIVVTWQKKDLPLHVEKQAAASLDLSPLDFGIWNLTEAKLRGNRAIDMDTLKADVSRAVTQLNSDAEWPTVVSITFFEHGSTASKPTRAAIARAECFNSPLFFSA